MFESAATSPVKMTNIVTPMKNTEQPTIRPSTVQNLSNQPGLNAVNLTSQQMLYNQMLLHQMNQQAAMMNPLMSQFFLSQMGSLMQGQQSGEGLNPAYQPTAVPSLPGAAHTTQTLPTMGQSMGPAMPQIGQATAHTAHTSQTLPSLGQPMTQAMPQMGQNVPMGLFGLPNMDTLSCLGRGSGHPVVSTEVNATTTQSLGNAGNMALLPGLLPLLETLSIGRGSGGPKKQGQ